MKKTAPQSFKVSDTVSDTYLIPICSFLILSLVVPSFAFALRSTNAGQEESSVRSGLEAALQSGNPDEAFRQVEQAGMRLAQSVGLPPVASKLPATSNKQLVTGFDAAGLEEGTASRDPMIGDLNLRPRWEEFVREGLIWIVFTDEVSSDHVGIGLKEVNGSLEFQGFNETKGQVVQEKVEEKTIGPGRFTAQLNGYRRLRPGAGKAKEVGRQKDLSLHDANCRFCSSDERVGSVLVREKPIAQLSVNGRIWRVSHNAAPFETRGHFILMPDLNVEKREQRILPKDLEDMIHAARNSKNLLIFYNAPHAGGTVNHIHFQAVYSDRSKPYAMENARQHLRYDLPGGVQVYELARYPARGFVFQGQDEKTLAEAVFRLINLMQERGTPFNLHFLKDRLFVFPRNIDQEVVEEFRGGVLASYELAGKFILVLDRDYETVTLKKIRSALKKTTLPPREFKGLLASAYGNAGLEEGIPEAEIREVMRILTGLADGTLDARGFIERYSLSSLHRIMMTHDRYSFSFGEQKPNWDQEVFVTVVNHNPPTTLSRQMNSLRVSFVLDAEAIKASPANVEELLQSLPAISSIFQAYRAQEKRVALQLGEIVAVPSSYVSHSSIHNGLWVRSVGAIDTKQYDRILTKRDLLLKSTVSSPSTPPSLQSDAAGLEEAKAGIRISGKVVPVNGLLVSPEGNRFLIKGIDSEGIVLQQLTVRDPQTGRVEWPSTTTSIPAVRYSPPYQFAKEGWRPYTTAGLEEGDYQKRGRSKVQVIQLIRDLRGSIPNLKIRKEYGLPALTGNRVTELFVKLGPAASGKFMEPMLAISIGRILREPTWVSEVKEYFLKVFDLRATPEAPSSRLLDEKLVPTLDEIAPALKEVLTKDPTVKGILESIRSIPSVALQEDSFPWLPLGPGEMVGRSRIMQDLFERVEDIRNDPTKGQVLILGNTGSGKSRLAETLGPFLRVNAGQLSTLHGSDLERRLLEIFQGAKSSNIIIDDFHLANRDLQSSLRQPLEERTYIDRGKAIPIKGRFIATASSTEGISPEVLRRFDYTLEMPSVSQRSEDIVLLAEYFNWRFSQQFGIPWAPLDEYVGDLLVNYFYSWEEEVSGVENMMRAILSIRQQYVSGRIKPSDEQWRFSDNKSSLQPYWLPHLITIADLALALHFAPHREIMKLLNQDKSLSTWEENKNDPEFRAPQRPYFDELISQSEKVKAAQSTTGLEEATVEELIGKLQDPDASIRLDAAYVLRRRGLKAEAAVPALIHVLRGNGPDCHEAVRTLAKIASADDGITVPALIDLLRLTDEHDHHAYFVIGSAIADLGTIALMELVKLMDSEDGNERASAIRALSIHVEGEGFRQFKQTRIGQDPLKEFYSELRDLETRVIALRVDSSVSAVDLRAGLAKISKVSATKAKAFVMDPIKIYYTSDEIGSNLTELLAVTARTNPAFDVSKFELALLSEENPPGAYSIVVKGVGESLPLEKEWRNDVAVIVFSHDSSLAKILQEALSLWLRRPIGEVIGVQTFENGRLAIYV